MVLMRQGLLWLSERQGMFNFVRRNGLARKFASRFVAGEGIDDGVRAAKELSRRGITASLDLLGESVTAEAEAIAARDQYLRMLDRMAESGVEVNVSVMPGPQAESDDPRGSGGPVAGEGKRAGWFGITPRAEYQHDDRSRRKGRMHR